MHHDKQCTPDPHAKVMSVVDVQGNAAINNTLPWLNTIKTAVGHEIMQQLGMDALVPSRDAWGYWTAMLSQALQHSNDTASLVM